MTDLNDAQHPLNGPATSSFTPSPAVADEPTAPPVTAQPVTAPPVHPQPVPTAKPQAAPVVAPTTTASANPLNPVLTLLLGGVLACVLFGLGLVTQARRTTTEGEPVALVNPFGGVNDESNNAIVRAVRLVGPAVMNVDTTFNTEANAADSQFLPAPGAGQMPQEGKGTGFVYDSQKGLMLTNAHVVAPGGRPAKQIQVTTRDGKKYSGKLVGFDRNSDIAVVKLPPGKLPAAKLALMKDALDLDIGQWAIAIGNPFGQANTVTVGVVSAVGRSIPVPPEPGMRSGGELKLNDMVQTDTAINPGNSGGPLCNVKGEVIGINTAIISPAFATGLGFSIPIIKARQIADLLVSNGGRMQYLGVEMLPVTANEQKFYGLPDRNGALVKSVVKGQPAATAGLEPGDVIRSIDGQPVKTPEDLVATVRKKKIGDSVQVEVLRNSSVKKTFKMKIGAQPSGG